MAETVTVGLTSHLPYVTDLLYQLTGSMAKREIYLLGEHYMPVRL